MNNELPLYITKYLNKYASDKWKPNSVTENRFKTIIVIPVISEFKNLPSLINSLRENDKKHFSETLILFVVNNLLSSSEGIKEDNLRSIDFLKNILQTDGLTIDFVDASTKGNELDEKNGGVGLARKIGMDIALTLFNYNSDMKNILICLDGDCTVKQNYISTIRNYFDRNNISAGYVNFNHSNINVNESEEAIVNYEIFLRYYVLGLIYAGSPFAYHSIGSTMVCDTESYTRVQGMNKRKAAEDFYFMEKLSKITKIHKIDGTAVFPSGRGSWRVPFGTGQRVNRFLERIQDEYVLYSPKSFDVLKEWINVFYSDKTLSASEYLEIANSINPVLNKFLNNNNFEKSWNKIICNTKSDIQIQKQKSLWFDGFRTLKLIHYLRDEAFPLINMFDALDELFDMIKINIEFPRGDSEIPTIDIQKKYLDVLRQIA